MFYIYLLNPIGPKLQSVSLCPSFCFPDRSIEGSGVLEGRGGTICDFSFSKVSFMNEGALVFGA